jgi:LuxR family maltose regulon positive regulatory protein
VGCEAHLGLARIHYEWNDLAAAEEHARKGGDLARQIAQSDRFIVDDLWLARVKLAQGDPSSAAALLAQATQAITPYPLWLSSPESLRAQCLILLGLGRYDEALRLVQAQALPLHAAQAQLAQGDVPAASAALVEAQLQAQANGWADDLLHVKALQAVVCHLQGAKAEALQRLSEALAIAEPEGFVRLFLDKGQPMRQLLVEAAARGIQPAYVTRLLAAFEAQSRPQPSAANLQPLEEPLSRRELEVLRLIAQGLSNDEIGKRLFLALDTVKGHNRKIFEKLGVQRRTEAVAEARRLGLL